MKQMQMKQMQRKIISLALALFVLSGMFCIPVSAIKCILIENTYSTAVPISVGTKLQIGERQTGIGFDDSCAYYNVDMKYKFTVTETCEVTFELSTEDHPSSAHKEYLLDMQLLCADASTLVYSHADGKYNIRNLKVTSDAMPLSKQIKYKICPGDYYIRVLSIGAYNAFGWLEFKSIEVFQDDFGGEPNDTIALAQAKPGIKTGVDYVGNIAYEGKMTDSSGYRHDYYDYYRFDVPNDGYSVKLTAERADKHRNNDFDVILVHSNDRPVDYTNHVDLKIFPSGSCEYKDLEKGMYFVRVGSGYPNKYPTEYTFRLDATGETATPAKNPFTDVKELDWYYKHVIYAYGVGLINGKGATAFAPEDNLTYAEAVKLAACMHELHTTGKVTLAVGSGAWYQSYVDYAKKNKIISKDYDWNKAATRAGYMEIFANALPDSALAAMNSVADGAIPDVPATHPQAWAIYKLYRAGILQGVDAAHNCKPDANIMRCEVAAILTRMMDPSARVEFSLK